MKKTFFLLAMCLIGMCSAYAVSLPGTPIVFVDIYGVMPCDDDLDGDGGGGSPDPNQEVVGSIDGDDLNIGIVGGGVGQVIVIDPEIGDVIIDEDIIGQASFDIPDPGTYTAYVIVDGTTYAGEFEVK